MPRVKAKISSQSRSKSVDYKNSNDKDFSVKKITHKNEKPVDNKLNNTKNEKPGDNKLNNTKNEKPGDIEEEEADEEEEIDDIDIDADEDEFFDEKNFEDVNPHIQYHIYDPEKYENEIHKEIIVVPNNYRRTSEVITKFEYTDVTSNRAKQIENGSPIFTDIKGESDPIKMAELEIRMKRCPLSVRRMISNNICEIWDVNDMIIPY